MEKKEHYRHELKYTINYWQYLQLRSRFRQVMKMDPHTRADGTYSIRSIYFDNIQDKALREKVNGVAKREKFRIRYYNDNFERITLEKKIKNNNLCIKVSAGLTEKECRKLLNGDLEWMKTHSSSLVQELYGKMKYQQLRPRVLVSYTREPYIYAAGNVRITFDWNVRTTMYHGKFLEKKVYDVETGQQCPGEMIMEVKYDALYYSCDVVVNGKKFYSVGIRPKGNTSLSGTMAHNYYLYEYNGKLNILPWDYNLSFGGMSMGGGMGGQSSGATSVINDAIDTPFSITNFFDALLENEEYLAKYHEYLNELVEKYVNGGEFQKTYERIRSQINELLAEDPTAFYSYEEYEAAVEMLYEVINLRGESVSGQLDGTIPSTDDGQKADSSTLIDGSGIELSVMGSMSMGGGAGEGIGAPGGRGDGWQMRASGKEAGNSDGNEALQKTESGGV